MHAAGVGGQGGDVFSPIESTKLLMEESSTEADWS
jgi:hypothetical protein